MYVLYFKGDLIIVINLRVSLAAREHNNNCCYIWVVKLSRQMSIHYKPQKYFNK